MAENFYYVAGKSEPLQGGECVRIKGDDSGSTDSLFRVEATKDGSFAFRSVGGDYMRAEDIEFSQTPNGKRIRGLVYESPANVSRLSESESRVRAILR